MPYVCMFIPYIFQVIVCLAESFTLLGILEKCLMVAFDVLSFLLRALKCPVVFENSPNLGRADP